MTGKEKSAAPGIIRQYIEAPRGYRFVEFDKDLEGIVGIYVIWGRKE